MASPAMQVGPWPEQADPDLRFQLLSDPYFINLYIRLNKI